MKQIYTLAGVFNFFAIISCADAVAQSISSNVTIPQVCNSIISSGMKNTENVSQYHRLSEFQRSSMCKDAETGRSTSESSEVDIWYKKTSGKVEISKSDREYFRQYFCGSKQNNFSETEWRKRIATFYDANLVNVLETCIKEASGGDLDGVEYSEANGNYIVSAASSLSDNIVVGGIVKRNYTCSGSLTEFKGKSQKTLKGGTTENMLCYRDLATPSTCPDGTERYKAGVLAITIHSTLLTLANQPKTECLAPVVKTYNWSKYEVEGLNLAKTNSCTANGQIAKVCNQETLGLEVSIQPSEVMALGGEGGSERVGNSQGGSASLEGKLLTWKGRLRCDTVTFSVIPEKSDQYRCEFDAFDTPEITRYLGKDGGTEKWSHMEN